MAKSPLDLSKFKKVKSDAKTTTLQHPQGHQVTIIHAVLSPKMRKDLDSLPIHKMADGGQVSDKGPKVDPQKAAEMQKGATESGVRSPSEYWQNIKTGLGMAKGGKVPRYADGTTSVEASDDKRPLEIEPIKPEDQQSSAMDSVGNAVNSALGANEAEAHPQFGPMTNKSMQIEALTPEESLKALQQAPDIETKTKILQDYNQRNLGTPGQVAEYNKQAQLAGLPPKPSIEPQSPAIQADDPYGAKTTEAFAHQGYNEQRAALYGGADAEAKAIEAQQKALQAGANRQAANKIKYEDNVADLENERKGAVTAVEQGMIKPDHWWDNHKDMTQSLRWWTGLVLGGMGGADMHQVINDMINRDIDAQKTNLGAKETILKANLQHFGNLRDAADMTRIMINDQVANDVKKAALASGSQLAQMRALQAVGKLDSDSAGLMGNLAMRRTVLGQAGAGMLPPERIVQMLLPEHQQPEGYKEIKEMRLMSKFRDNALGAFDKLAQINTIGNRVAHLGFTPAQVAALREPILASLSKDTAGKFTEQDAAMLRALFPAPGDTGNTPMIKREQLRKLIDEKMNFPIMKNYNVDPFKLGMYDEAGRIRIPESPRVK